MNNIYNNSDMNLDKNIYVNTETINGPFNKMPEYPSSQTQPAGKQCYKWATVCVGLLCFLLLIAIIVLSVNYKLCTENIEANASALKAEIETNYTILLAQKDQLNAKYRECLTKQRCSQGWIGFGSRCYYFSSEQKTWTESQQDCKQRKADLVIINSIEEQVFINAFKLVYWIGLTDSNEEGSWKWVDGKELTTNFWKENEPNDLNENEDCAMTTPQSDPNKTWNDIFCSFKTNWICERQL